MSLTEAQREDIERRVDDGVWFLDHVIPDWADHVDLSMLDMQAWRFGFPSRCERGCVAMQVVGRDFEEAIADLALYDSDLFHAFAAFSSAASQYVGNAGWYYAHEVWQEAILDRRPRRLIGGEKIAC